MYVYRKATFDTPAHYLDNQTGEQWRRIVGGFSWPQEAQPGVGLILAETLGEPPSYKVLVAVQDHNAMTLVEKCKALEATYPVKQWHGNHGSPTMMLLLYEFNRGKALEAKLRFASSPLADEPHNSGYYLPKLIELGGQDRLNASLAPAVLRELENDEQWPDTHLNRDIAEFPALAALCYPLAYLHIYSSKVVRPKKPDYSQQYGAFGWQL